MYFATSTWFCKWVLTFLRSFLFLKLPLDFPREINLDKNTFSVVQWGLNFSFKSFLDMEISLISVFKLCPSDKKKILKFRQENLKFEISLIAAYFFFNFDPP